ncbi:MAG: hypothetical protein ABSA52_21730 [Candidatus Binatia bacterium]|jgi:hypothetical protein
MNSLWRTALGQDQQKQILFTLSFAREDPVASPHMALAANSWCMSTGVAHVVDLRSGRRKPFWPWLGAWPEITTTLRPQDHAATTADVQVQILADSGLAAYLRDHGGAQGATVRLDLWCPGIDLANVWPRFAGVVTACHIDRRTSSVTLTLSDGDPDVVQTWPPGPIVSDNFRQAPNWVLNGTSRQTVLGPGPVGVSCIQIDATGNLFYVADPPYSQWPSGPNAVQVGGAPYKSGFSFSTEMTPGTSTWPGFKYTQLALKTAAPQTGLQTAMVTVSGGVGYDPAIRDAISFLLWKGGFDLSPRAQALLADYARATYGAPLSVLANLSGSVLDIVRQQLVPQTPFAFRLHRTQADLIDLRATGPQRRVTLGAQLVVRLSDQQDETQNLSIFNATSILCGLDEFASSISGAQYPLFRIPRNSSDANTPLNIRALCKKSEGVYGNRFLDTPAGAGGYSAPDLAVLFDANGVAYDSPAGRILGDLVIQLCAMAHHPHSYQATWLDGYGFDLGDRVLLNDANESLVDEPCVVVQITESVTGPQITFQTEDLT